MVRNEKSIPFMIPKNCSSEISSVDIGNEGSAFVEVLVGKAAAAADTDFEVILFDFVVFSPI